MQRPREATAFGQVVRERREAANLSQERLGYKAGLHRNYVGGIERGERNPALLNLFKIARALETHPSDLLRATEEHLNTKP